MVCDFSHCDRGGIHPGLCSHVNLIACKIGFCVGVPRKVADPVPAAVTVNVTGMVLDVAPVAEMVTVVL